MYVKEREREGERERERKREREREKEREKTNLSMSFLVSFRVISVDFSHQKCNLSFALSFRFVDLQGECPESCLTSPYVLLPLYLLKLFG